MLTRSFCCFRGISAGAERKLWRAGCLTWEQLPLAGRMLSSRKTLDLASQLPEVRSALTGRVADYFIKRLPVGHRLRVCPEFAEGVAFLDVETTGLGLRDKLTVIGLWQAGRLRHFVFGRNLGEFLEVWRKIEVLVTFNGARFDLPVLMRTFGLTCPPPHIDLMCESKSYGYSGGLKSIERSLGIRRKGDEDGDGGDAVMLWKLYKENGDYVSLERLLRYNTRDVMSLLALAGVLLKRSFDGYPGPLPAFRSLTTESLPTNTMG
jgi:uncharacterized protein YprB with RNaseH-like and TPR domain